MGPFAKGCLFRHRNICWEYFADAIYKVVVAGQLGGSGFFAVIDPGCEEFFRVSAWVCSGDFPNVGGRSSVNESVDVRNITK